MATHGRTSVVNNTMQLLEYERPIILPNKRSSYSNPNVYLGVKKRRVNKDMLWERLYTYYIALFNCEELILSKYIYATF